MRATVTVTTRPRPVLVRLAGLTGALIAMIGTPGTTVMAQPRTPAAKAGKTPAAEPAADPAPAPAPPSPELEAQIAKTAALEAALKAESEQVTALRADLETRLRDEQAGRQRADAALEAKLANASTKLEQLPPVVTAARAGLSLTGYIQADLAFRQSSEDQLNGSTGEPLNEDRFLIRRARLRAAIDDTYVSGAVEFDGNTVRGPLARILAAEASLKWPGTDPAVGPLVMATMGLFKIPFGFEVRESDRDRHFLERSTMSRAFFPGEYDLGARVQGGWRFLRYALAVQNGDPVGEKLFPGRDPNDAKDVVGRLGLDASPVPALAMAAGVSGLWGKGLHKGTGATKTTLQWQDRNEDGRFQAGEIVTVAGVSAIPSESFPRHAIGLDGRIGFAVAPAWRTTVYGELVLANNLDRAIQVADPLGPLGRDQRELGYYVALLQDLGPYATIGARYDLYNPDRDSNNRQLGRQIPTEMSWKTLSLAASVHGRTGRLLAEYDLNRNKLGRDAAGVPANLKDNAFTLRAEARF
jgi:hypothetical protein